MSANRPLTVLLALLMAMGLGSGIATADQVWITADDQVQAPPQVLVTASDSTSISLDLDIPGFSIDRQKTVGGEFLDPLDVLKPHTIFGVDSTAGIRQGQDCGPFFDQLLSTINCHVARTRN